MMLLKTITIEGKKYRLMGTTYSDAVYIHGKTVPAGGACSSRLTTVELTAPNLRELVKDIVASARENHRVAGENLRTAVFGEKS